jgi:hypothetical protein
MATQWIETDWDALGRLALLWDEFYKAPDADGLKEIRLQSALFGLSPLDRSRLSWEIAKASEADNRVERREARSRSSVDPRSALMMARKANG